MGAESTEVQDRLPFSEAKQRALLGHLLNNERFFQQARTKLDPAWFIDGYAAKVFAAKCKFYAQHERVPTLYELKESPALLNEDTAVRKKCYETITLASNETTFFGLDVLKPELTDWLRTRLYSKHIDKSVKLFNAQKLEEAYAEMKAVNRQIDDIRFDNDSEVFFDNPIGFIDSQQVAKQDCLTFGSSLVDRLLLPEGVNGSLLPGDTTVLLAPTNIGKTTTMITIAAANMKLLGKSVLLLTHEGRPEDIQEKIWCCMTNQPKHLFYKMYESEDGKRLLAKAMGKLTKYLTYVPYNKAGATVEEVEAIVRRKQDERIARTGKGYDLLVCDYPSKLTTTQASKGNLQFRHIETHVYNIFVQLALEYKFHSLLAIQTNRQGSKKNRGHKSRWDDTGESSRLLTMEDVAESWGPMTIATNVISINRDERAMSRDRLTFHISKSRSNETGWSIVCRSKYAHSITHSNELGGTFYRSSHSMSEKIDDFLMTYENSSIPTTEVLKASADSV